jgi:hypothetical protein
VITRRQLIKATVGVLGTSLVDRAVFAAQSFPPLPPSLKAFDSSPDFFSLNLRIEELGTAKPTNDERRIASEIIDSAPFNTAPIVVASHFADVGTGKFGPAWQPYARGWPIRYNPIIVDFFTTTRTNPLDPSFDGDATPWCAAFVNWCIARGASTDGKVTGKELALTTGSASSGSFRCWHMLAQPPQQGDIVVWRAPGTENKCPTDGRTLEAKGHVAFFVKELPNDQLLVVGGNQRLENSSQHGVTMTTIPRSFLAGVHSIRSVNA